MLKLLLPVFSGPAAIARASRSSVFLATDPGVEGRAGGYYDRRGEPTEWPAFATDPDTCAAVWRECARVAASCGPSRAGDEHRP
ncbi:hypothetical protein V5P93_002787 [Actinokineospora auranticolor]|uniref:hypothetical protein n=1 Tax=Actinokineospora auranticolor TaxID=155976 RepID=UPI000CEBC37C|nr:hypothetical protein [Actinokineospora auranticolor]